MTSIEGYGPILASSTVEGADERRVAATADEVESLVPAYSPLLFRVAYAVLRDRGEAEDAVQETFLRVLTHRADLPGVLDMRVWLVRIAWRIALDRKRRITPDQIDELFLRSIAGSERGADEALAESRELAVVLAEIERLPRAEKHVLLLSAVEEMRTGEIAGVLGKSESAVRALLFRARTRLRERVERRGKR